jgi:hypothetical protein
MWPLSHTPRILKPWAILSFVRFLRGPASRLQKPDERDAHFFIAGQRQFGRRNVLYCFDVRFRVSRPIPDRLEEDIRSATGGRPVRLWRPLGTARDERWLAIKSCGHATFEEARNSGLQVEDALLIAAAKERIGVELIGRGAISSVSVYSEGQVDVVDPGAPLPVPLKDEELIEIVTAAVQSASTLTCNQRIAAELLNDSFFEMSSEARFLLRISAVEALCPQDNQAVTFKAVVDHVVASIPIEASDQDRNQIKQTLTRLATKQSARSAYMHQIKRLLGNDRARQFDKLYAQRSKLLHDGTGRGTLGRAANAALEISLELLLANVRANQASGANPRRA